LSWLQYCEEVKLSDSRCGKMAWVRFSTKSASTTV